MLNLAQVLPLGLSPNSTSLLVPDGGLSFPDRFSPLQGTFSHRKDSPHYRFEYGDGVDHRQKKGLVRSYCYAKFDIILVSTNGDIQALNDFTEVVGCHDEFEMTLPEVGTRLWYFEEIPEPKHIHGYHYKASVSLKSQRVRR